jgi:hypothetical protein
VDERLGSWLMESWWQAQWWLILSLKMGGTVLLLVDTQMSAYWLWGEIDGWRGMVVRSRVLLLQWKGWLMARRYSWHSQRQ